MLRRFIISGFKNDFREIRECIISMYNILNTYIYTYTIILQWEVITFLLGPAASGSAIVANVYTAVSSGLGSVDFEVSMRRYQECQVVIRPQKQSPGCYSNTYTLEYVILLYPKIKNTDIFTNGWAGKGNVKTVVQNKL